MQNTKEKVRSLIEERKERMRVYIYIRRERRS